MNERPDAKPAGEEGVFARVYLRRCAKPIVSLLSRTSVTPNQITATFLGLMLSGALLLLGQRWYWVPVAGAGLLQIGLVLDAVDGAIARIRGIYSIKGVYLDMVGHRLVHAVLFTCTGFGAWIKTGQILPVALGSLATIGELGLTLVLYAKWRALLDHPDTLIAEVQRVAATPKQEQRRLKAGFPDAPARRNVVSRFVGVWFGVDYVGALLLTTLVAASVGRCEILLWIYAPLQLLRLAWQVVLRVRAPFTPERPEAS